MATPDGRELSFIARGDAGAPVAAEPGAKLEDGWVIEAISDNRIDLLHTATNVRSSILVPQGSAPAAR